MAVSCFWRRCWRSAIRSKARADADQLAALLEERREKEARDAATLAKLENFRLLFVDAMELSLTGKLTVARLRGLVERRSA